MFQVVCIFFIETMKLFDSVKKNNKSIKATFIFLWLKTTVCSQDLNVSSPQLWTGVHGVSVAPGSYSNQNSDPGPAHFHNKQSGSIWMGASHLTEPLGTGTEAHRLMAALQRKQLHHHHHLQTQHFSPWLRNHLRTELYKFWFCWLLNWPLWRQVAAQLQVHQQPAGEELHQNQNTNDAGFTCLTGLGLPTEVLN